MAEEPGPRQAVQPWFGIKPPIVWFLLVAVGVAVHFILPVHALPEGGVQFIGVPIAIGGMAFAMAANVAFHKVGTDDRFASATSSIVQDGVLSRSRNPMYVGLVLITLGIMLGINSAVSLLVLPFLVLYLQFGVIQREEEYLTRWFGQDYSDYKAKVRRWI